MQLTIRDIEDRFSIRAVGDRDRLIKGVSSFDDAVGHEITFASDPKFIKKLDQTRAGAVILPESEQEGVDPSLPHVFLFSEQPKIDFFKLVSLFHPHKAAVPGIHATVCIGTDSDISDNPVIGPNVVIGNQVSIGRNVRIASNVSIGDHVCIGDDVTIHPNVTIMEKTRIGNRAMVHPGVVIGSDGFGFAPSSGAHEKLVHAGFVEIFDDVEIGANTTIDRGTLGRTQIGRGVKIDNQVHIAHNVKIGDHTLIVAQVGIAGSTTIENNVILAGKAGISGHLTIGANAIVGPYAGVHSSVAKGQIVSGIPQIPHSRWKKVVSILSRLPEMRKQIFSFDKRLKQLEDKNP